MISEDSMREKKQRNKTAINQVIKMRLLSSEPLEKILPERKRGKIPRDDKGQCHWVHRALTTSDIWKATVEEKAAMYGPRVIGSDAAAAEDEIGEAETEKQQPRKPTSYEPFNFNFLPRTFYADCLATYSVVSWLV